MKEEGGGVVVVVCDDFKMEKNGEEWCVTTLKWVKEGEVGCDFKMGKGERGGV